MSSTKGGLGGGLRNKGKGNNPKKKKRRERRKKRKNRQQDRKCGRHNPDGEGLYSLPDLNTSCDAAFSPRQNFGSFSVHAYIQLLCTVYNSTDRARVSGLKTGALRTRDTRRVALHPSPSQGGSTG